MRFPRMTTRRWMVAAGAVALTLEVCRLYGLSKHCRRKALDAAKHAFYEESEAHSLENSAAEFLVRSHKSLAYRDQVAATDGEHSNRWKYHAGIHTGVEASLKRRLEWAKLCRRR